MMYVVWLSITTVVVRAKYPSFLNPESDRNTSDVHVSQELSRGAHGAHDAHNTRRGSIASRRISVPRGVKLHISDGTSVHHRRKMSSVHSKPGIGPCVLCVTEQRKPHNLTETSSMRCQTMETCCHITTMRPQGTSYVFEVNPTS